jgi:hypothetical protein
MRPERGTLIRRSGQIRPVKPQPYEGRQILSAHGSGKNTASLARPDSRGRLSPRIFEMGRECTQPRSEPTAHETAAPNHRGKSKWRKEVGQNPEQAGQAPIEAEPVGPGQALKAGLATPRKRLSGASRAPVVLKNDPCQPDC